MSVMSWTWHKLPVTNSVQKLSWPPKRQEFWFNAIGDHVIMIYRNVTNRDTVLMAKWGKKKKNSTMHDAYIYCMFGCFLVSFTSRIPSSGGAMAPGWQAAVRVVPSEDAIRRRRALLAGRVRRGGVRRGRVRVPGQQPAGGGLVFRPTRSRHVKGKYTATVGLPADALTQVFLLLKESMLLPGQTFALFKMSQENFVFA